MNDTPIEVTIYFDRHATAARLNDEDANEFREWLYGEPQGPLYNLKTKYQDQVIFRSHINYVNFVDTREVSF